MKKYETIIVDDHELFANALGSLINGIGNFTFTSRYKNGKELADFLDQNGTVDLVLLDLKMPVMDGVETMKWIQRYYPTQKVLVLYMEDDESLTMSMNQNGALGYVTKDVNIQNFKRTLDQVLHFGFYYNKKISDLLLKMAKEVGSNSNSYNFNERELEFIKCLALN